MARRAGVLGIVMAMALFFGLSCLATTQPKIDAFEVSDLWLLSTASRPDWTDRWTAPVEAATILAWLHLHGFPDFLPNLNADGTVDELDAIELADRFGKGGMETGTARGTTDPLLVFTLAQYVARRYPNQFELKIYDASFPVEFERDIHVPFTSGVVPGITLTLKPEPTYDAYRLELHSGQGVIVGIEQQVDRNYYFAGRSFRYDKTVSGNYAVDLAWAEPDPWAAKIQGQVLQTEAKETDALYLLYQGAWVKVEFMLALSPVIEPQGEIAQPCRNIVDDTTTSITLDVGKAQIGEVQIIECLDRSPTIDTYCYILNNKSFVSGGCGVCEFFIPIPTGVTTSGIPNQPTGWTGSFTSGGCLWMGTGCGIMPGSSATFCFSVVTPTVDGPAGGYVGSCAFLVPPQLYKVQTTGPNAPKCADLIVDVTKCTYTCRIVDGPAGLYCQCDLTVTVIVTNIGAGPTPNSFSVCLNSCCGSATHTYSIVGGLPGNSSTLPITLHISCTSVPPCPLSCSYTVVADCFNQVPECPPGGEWNNDVNGECMLAR